MTMVIMRLYYRNSLQKIINLHKIHFYKNTFLQKTLIILAIILAFWHGIWDSVPRADQVPYLHQISQFHNLSDIIKNSFAWNRVIGGDIILFRPILYMQLGIFYHFFGYNFTLWQVSSLIMHILVVIGVYSLLLKGRLQNTLYPLLLSLLLGVALTSSELVFWHHIGGYLLFCMLSVYSIIFLIKYFDTHKNIFLWITLLLVTLAEFTYELGCVLNVFIGMVFLYRNTFPHLLQNNSPNNGLKWSVLFIIASLLYPIISAYNLWSIDLLQDVIKSTHHKPTTGNNSSIFFIPKSRLFSGLHACSYL